MSARDPFNFSYGLSPNLEQENRDLRRRLEEISRKPQLFATVLDVGPDRVTVQQAAQFLNLARPTGKAFDDLRAGQMVLIAAGDPPSILSIVGTPPVLGPIVTAKTILKPGLVEVAFQNHPRAVKTIIDVKPGDRVVLDLNGYVVVENLGRSVASPYAYHEPTGISWDDIGGQDEAKRALREAIEEPAQHRDLYARYKRRPVKGILLHGPPGCIASEMHVPYSVRDADGRKQNGKGGTIENLYRRFNKIPRKGKGFFQRPQTVDSRFFVPSMDEDGKVFQNEIAEVLYSGVKKCIRVVTAGGLALVCTPDHPLAVTTGFVPAEKLHIGAAILVHRNVHWSRDGAKKVRTNRPEFFIKHHPYASTKVVRDPTRGYENVYRRISRAKAVYEARLNGLNLVEYLALLNDGLLDGLKFVEPGNDVHHLDENPLNDVPENLFLESHAEHARRHMIDETGRPRLAHIAIEDEIVTIEEVAALPTYDIRMKERPHNFVVERFVVHNTGKTLLARAAATALARAHAGKQAQGQAGFFYVKGPELLSKWVGEAEAAIRDLFSAARAHRDEHGYPAIIFIDECDALLTKRGNQALEGVERTVVPAFLSEMDGLVDSSAMLILATNRIDQVDPAAIRPGRIDRKIKVARPDTKDVTELFKVHLRRVPLADYDAFGVYDDEACESLAKKAVENFTMPEHAWLGLVIKGGRERHHFGLWQLRSGALVADIVDRATQVAIRREIKSKKVKNPGVSLGDLKAGMVELRNEVRHADNTSELSEFVEALGSPVESVEKLCP